MVRTARLVWSACLRPDEGMDEGHSEPSFSTLSFLETNAWSLVPSIARASCAQTALVGSELVEAPIPRWLVKFGER